MSTENGISAARAEPVVSYLDVWLVMVKKPTGEWGRVGPVYRQKHVAASWVTFVKSSYHGATTRVRYIRIPLIAPGKTTDAMRRKLSEKYAIDLS